jgi:hypothetical protein
MIKINIEFKDAKKFDNLIRYIENNLVYGEAQEAMIGLAENTVKNMRDTISSSKKRHSLGSNLEDAIEATILNTIGGIDIGIGNIYKLKSQAPYWEVLDAGGYVPYSTVKGAPLGSFEGSAPDSTLVSGNQNWERSGKGFFMKPKSPIEGIDYVGKAIRELDKELKETIIRMGGTFLDGLKKSSTGYGYSIGGAH